MIISFLPCGGVAKNTRTLCQDPPLLPLARFPFFLMATRGYGYSRFWSFPPRVFLRPNLAGRTCGSLLHARHTRLPAIAQYVHRFLLGILRGARAYWLMSILRSPYLHFWLLRAHVVGLDYDNSIHPLAGLHHRPPIISLRPHTSPADAMAILALIHPAQLSPYTACSRDSCLARRISPRSVVCLTMIMLAAVSYWPLDTISLVFIFFSLSRCQAEERGDGSMKQDQICEENLRFFFLCLRFRSLTLRETKYVFWKIMGKKNAREIARMDGRRLSKQAISLVVCKAVKKIQHKYCRTLKNHMADFT